MPNLNYISYKKISSNFNKYKLTETDYRLFKKVDWVVTEKVHGANFCLLTDGKIIKYAKRKEILAEREDFFGHSLLTTKLAAQALAVYDCLKDIYPELQQITIYGELFGGEYPHPDVTDNPKVQAIQTGVYYSPNIEFIAFDIAYFGRQQQHQYLNYDRFSNLCQQTNLFYSRALFRGKYQNAVTYNIHFTTTIPNLLGLPALPIPNSAEGIVIKPATSLIIETIKGKIRPILKLKTAEFSEDKRFHQAQKWDYRGNNKYPKTVNITDELLETETIALITHTRFDNLISKIGKPKKLGKKKRDYIIQIYVQDVIEDLQDNLDFVFDDLNIKTQTKLKAIIKERSQSFLT